MNTELLDQVEKLAGSQRNKTFRAAAEFVLKHNCRQIVETGCFRGNPADGQSTLILAMLAKGTGGRLYSYDTSEVNINLAIALLASSGLTEWASLIKCDSVYGLAWCSPPQFVYLDSYDHEANNPGPCQRHQLAEVGAVIGRMQPPCAILLDDHIAGTGGKTLLSSTFLNERGWKLAAEGYQLLFVKDS
jgi:hypothetical protein